MSNKIEMLSPKIEIIDHFDSLINRVDIDIDECLGKCIQEQVLSQLKCFHIGQRKVRGEKNIYLNGLSEKDIKYETVDEWPESTKVVDLDIFDNIGKIEKIDLSQNPIINKDEFLNRSLQSNIKVYFS